MKFRCYKGHSFVPLAQHLISFGHINADTVQGIGTQLVKAALTHAGGKSVAEVETRVILQNEYGDVSDHMLRKTGFEVVDTATIIRYANNEKCSRSWAAFMKKKGDRICSALVGRGFKTLPFSEASSETFDRLKACIGRDFPANDGCCQLKFTTS